MREYVQVFSQTGVGMHCHLSLRSVPIVHVCTRRQDPWPPANVTVLAQRSARWLVTRGEHGADEITAAGTVSLPAEKVCAGRRYQTLLSVPLVAVIGERNC